MKKTIKMPTKLVSAYHKSVFAVRKHSPEILIVAGVIGVVTSGVLACRATLKAKEVLDGAKEDLKLIDEALKDEKRADYTEEVAKSDLDGMIFTLMWAFERQEDWDWVQRIKDIYDKENGEFYVVELQTTLEERLKRNKTENRLKNKPTKRDLEFSEKDLLKSVEKHRLNSYEGEVKYENYLKIDNTNISAENTAKIIKEKFGL